MAASKQRFSGRTYANGNHVKQQQAYNRSRKGKDIIIAANAANRAKGTYGNRDGLDVAHKKGKEGSKLAKDVTLKKPKNNRNSRLKIRKA